MAFVEIIDPGKNEPVLLYYQDIGEGQPVVLIHGWPLSHEMWEHQAIDLAAAGFRVIAYDRRGFGKSSKAWTGYDYDTLADDLHALINQLDLQHVVLVGFSMGGGEVARYFSRHGSERIEKAVLISAVTPYMLQTPDNPDGVKESVFHEMAEGIRNDRFEFLDGFQKEFFGLNIINKPVSDSMLLHYRMLASQASLHATLEASKAFAFTDFRDDMKHVTVPTLVIHGDKDKIVPITATSEQSRRMIPETTYVRYADAPHGLFYTERERLSKDLIRFIHESVPFEVE